MVYLEYNMLGNKKKIKIKGIDHNGDKHVIQYDENHYEYKVGGNEQKIFKKLLKILKLWNELAKDCGVEYWACSGTLLGAVRHSGFIPWDNDIDISIMLPDFKTVKRKLEEHPILTCCECEQGLQVRYRDHEFPFMDIFVCDYYDETTIKYCGFLSKHHEPTWFIDDCFPNERIYKNELYPLKIIDFEDTTITIPNIQKNVLFRTYSEKCLTSCKIQKHTGVHEVCSIKIMELRYKYFKKIYEIERRLNVPRNIMFISLQYKVAKKIEEKMNSGKKNVILNKFILKTFKNISKLCDSLYII